ncbi:amino acid transporter [Tothia fuscella]|uniref:Amino acid transporter n=1 Tax=Tothia fuscella TaxID=1048955 RepID=A0A9P4TXW2_9PEZI|nr:amino acid transporter [Tothia fuscella]
MSKGLPKSVDHNSSSVLLESNGHGIRDMDLELMSEADRVLASNFGYRPVFKREFGYLATFSFAVSIGGVYSSIATTFIYPLEAGGSASIVWCWLISGAGCMCLALSVSELVSAYPTCGGMYYTVSRLAPKRYVPFVSWITGWLNILGQLAGVAASEWGAAALFLAAVSIGSDFSYLPTVNHTVGVMAVMVVISGLVNSLSTFWIEKMTRCYVIFHIAILVSCAIALLAMAQPKNGTPKHTAKYVFTDVNNQSGWTPASWSFMFGFLSVSWTMSGYDATAHISEEMKNPEIKAPWAISLGMLFTYLAGWLYNIVLCFVMGAVTGEKSILTSPIQQPVAQIYYNVLGKAGGIFFTVCSLIILKFGNFTAMQSLTRTIYALSRDGLLPFSGIWTRIMPLTGIPILAVWMSVLVAMGINLIGLGSYPAIAGVFNVCAIALDYSFCIPILCKIIYGRFVPGPWHLGKYSMFINVYACLWTFFVSIIFIMPTIRPVTPVNMNYAVVYLVAILIFSMIYWLIHGKKYYKGPPLENRSQSVASHDLQKR